MDPNVIVNFATPVIVPLIIAGIKKLKPNIPTWLIPALSPFLGLLLAYVGQLALHSHANWALAAVLGIAGVGVRELKDQLTKPSEPKD